MTRCFLVLLFVSIATAGPVANSTLAQRVRAAPRSDRALAALNELDKRGAEGWRWLSTLIRDVARKDADAARRVIKVLAGDASEARLTELERAWRESLPASVRADLAVSLAIAYPARKDRLERALFDSKLPRRRDLLQELAKRKLPTDVIRKCLSEKALADAAFSILLDRGWSPQPSELKVVAERFLDDDFSVDRLCRELSKGRMWALMDAIAALTSTSLKAHVLLLRVSGRDIARDALLWKSWLAANRDKYKIPSPDAPGRIAAGIVLGVEFLRQDLLKDGQSDQDGRHAVGATALSILALRAAGVPKDDPAIGHALKTTIFDAQGALVKSVYRINYTCSITIMALASVDAERYRHKIQRLANVLVASQLANGQWTYALRDAYVQRKAGSERRTRATRQAAPRTGDNSNTQYALLGLRAARHAGASVSATTWMRAMAFWQSSSSEEGWSYAWQWNRATTLSMTAAGISSLAICYEGLFGKLAAAKIARSETITRGLRALGKDLTRSGFSRADLYGYYGVERACILTNVRWFNDFDWYRAGAVNLLAAQNDDGAFVQDRAQRGWRFGPAVNTAYALLFLKRATTPIAGGNEHRRVPVAEASRARPRSRMNAQ